MGYRVRWPYLTVQVHNDPMKPTVHGFHEGAVLPVNADPDNVKALLAKGALEEFGEAVAEAPAEPESGQELESVPPAASASKAEWVDHAVALRDEGVSEEDARAAAEAMTKAELVAEFG